MQDAHMAGSHSKLCNTAVSHVMHALRRRALDGGLHQLMCTKLRIPVCMDVFTNNESDSGMGMPHRGVVADVSSGITWTASSLTASTNT